MKKHHLFSLFAALILAAMTYSTPAHAQIVGDIEANIPFQFHAGDTKLPPGKYVIHMVEDSDLKLMEISSADDSTSALFQVQATQANSQPAKTELVFNKYGNRYFLEQLFDEGERDGSQVVKSHYEERVGRAAAEAQIHVSANHRPLQETGGA